MKKRFGKKADVTPPFDYELANKLIGKRIIIALTYLDSKKILEKQEQFHGIVMSANAKDGVEVKLHDSDEIYSLPPDLRSIKYAEKGTYKLIASGEMVKNPDYVSDWVIESGHLPYGGWERPNHG